MLGPIGAAPFLVAYVFLVSMYALTWMLLCGLITLYGRALDLFGTRAHHCDTSTGQSAHLSVRLRGAFVRLFSATTALFGYVGTHVTSCELGDAAYMLSDDTDSSTPRVVPFAQQMNLSIAALFRLS